MQNLCLKCVASGIIFAQKYRNYTLFVQKEDEK